MTRLIAPHGTIVDVDGDAEERLIAEGWKAVGDHGADDAKAKRTRAPRAKD